jgi:hypothetical protein
VSAADTLCLLPVTFQMLCSSDLLLLHTVSKNKIKLNLLTVVQINIKQFLSYNLATEGTFCVLTCPTMIRNTSATFRISAEFSVQMLSLVTFFH